MDFSIDFYLGSSDRIIEYLKEKKITSKEGVEKELRSSAQESVRMAVHGGGDAGVRNAIDKVGKEFGFKLFK